MFNLFKKNKALAISSPINGKVSPITEANDEVFREKMMGDGFFVSPADGVLLSPVEGVVRSIFPTKHALIITTKDNIDVLIHIGTDTVELAGAPFDIRVKENDQVNRRTELVSVNFDMIRQAGKGDEVYILFPELEKSKDFLLEHTGIVSVNEPVGSIV